MEHTKEQYMHVYPYPIIIISNSSEPMSKEDLEKLKVRMKNWKSTTFMIKSMER